MMQKEKDKKDKKEKGRSMVEMLGVLAIAGLLSMAGFVGYSKAMETYRYNKQVDQIKKAEQEVRTFYSHAGEDTFKGLTSDMLLSLNPTLGSVSPTSEVGYPTTGSQIMNVYGGRIGARPISLADGGDGNELFVITVSNIPQETCVKLAKEASWKGKKLVAFSVNGMPSKVNRGSVDKKQADGEWLRDPNAGNMKKNICKKVTDNTMYFVYR